MKKLTQRDVLEIVSDKVREAGSQKAFAVQANISEQYLSDILKNRRSPGPKLLEELGLCEVRLYERKKEGK